ncbi:hypothetical protein SprV_0702361900 [Sparganum proliferum]
MDGFCPVYEGSATVGSHLLALVLQPSSSKEHVGGPAALWEVAVAFWQQSLLELAAETIEEKTSDDLPDDVE